jgi:ribosomal protein S18 acetylase RimI-like enzyme
VSDAPDIAVRAATVADYDAYARLMPMLEVDDPVPSRERFVDFVARTVIADVAGVVVGYALMEQLADTGYVRNVVTDPAWRQRGVGLALMAALRARFVAAGATAWCLNVKPDNAAAIALYTRCGLAAAYQSSVLRFPRELELATPPPDLATAPLPADDDDAVEARFRLLRGQLASARARRSVRVLGLYRYSATLRVAAGEAGACDRVAALVGVGSFNPAIPGAFPFRLARPELGPAFVALLRPHAPATAAYVQVGVEDDDALHAALEAAGGRCHLFIQHMRGAL